MASLSDRQIDAVAHDPEALVELLIEAGKQLSPQLRERILALGLKAVLPLLALLQDAELRNVDAPGEGWVPIHAAELLGELGAPEAVEPMLRALDDTEPGYYLYDTLVRALPRLGAAVVEPALAAYRTADPEFRSHLCSVLAKLGVKDERIYAALVEEYPRDPVLGAIHFAEYGDPRALPLLSKTVDEYVEDTSDNLLANQLLVEVVEAIKELGGTLTPEQQEKVDSIFQHDDARRRRLLSALDYAMGRMDLATSPVRGARALTAEPRPARAVGKVGRNDPCPCGSGKKYKKCCLGKDEG
jgi:hypothetical protein